MKHLFILGMILFVFFLTGCITADDKPDSNDDNDTESHLDDDDDLTDDDDSDISLDRKPPNLFFLFPELNNLSVWKAHYDSTDPIANHMYGGFALGNSHVFSFMASRPPFATFHNINGPTYQKHLKFFSDKTLSLENENGTISWQEEFAYRLRDTAIVLTESRSEKISLWTVNFAPWSDEEKNDAAQNTIFQLIIVQNKSEETLSGLKARMSTVIGRTESNLIIESIPTEDRHLAAGFVSDSTDLESNKRSSALLLPDLLPGEELTGTFLFAFSDGESAVSTFDQVKSLDPEQLLQQTIETWQDKTSQGARIETSSRRFDDLIEGLNQTMVVQQASTGCYAQMSEYGYNALRDMYGIARFFPLIGRNEEYKAMLDYLWDDALSRGNINADVSIDLIFDDPLKEPDWENLPTFTGRTKAETPSYLILMYKEYLMATGDWAPLQERYGMLRHSIIHQDIRNGCLLPFSDDETFRIAMMASFGHPLTEGYNDKYLSANSSFLFVAAADFMVQVAEHFGFVDDATQYEQLASDVRQCTEEYYWLDDGYYAPIIDIDTLEPDIRPFEDVSTRPLWIGYLASDDEQAASNIVSLMDLVEEKDGLFYSPLAPKYWWLGMLIHANQGIVTGMTPGYQIDNLARLDHPAAENAFFLYETFFHDSGNVSEGHTVDDFGRVSYMYEPLGAVCDLTARYRSWEGAIDAAALLQYLFGLELDAVANKITIAPHLPSDWTNAKMENARLGDIWFDILVEDIDSVRKVTISQATGNIIVDATISVEGSIDQVSVNDDPVSVPVESNWGRSRAILTDLEVTPGQPLEITIRPEK